LSLVLGELVPKRFALQRVEAIALTAAVPIDVLATFFRPFIAALSASTNLIVRLLGGDPSASKDQISGEELRDLVAAHEDLSADERRLIDDVFDAGDREGQGFVAIVNETFAEGFPLKAEGAPTEGFGIERFVQEARDGTSTWDMYIGVTPFLEMIALAESGAIEPWDPYLPAGFLDDLRRVTALFRATRRRHHAVSTELVATHHDANERLIRARTHRLFAYRVEFIEAVDDFQLRTASACLAHGQLGSFFRPGFFEQFRHPGKLTWPDDDIDERCPLENFVLILLCHASKHADRYVRAFFLE